MRKKGKVVIGTGLVLLLYGASSGPGYWLMRKEILARETFLRWYCPLSFIAQQDTPVSVLLNDYWLAWDPSSTFNDVPKTEKAVVADSELLELGNHVAVDAFSNLQLIASKHSHLAAFPECLWKVRCAAIDEEKLKESSFFTQDAHELAYLRKVLAEVFGSAYVPGLNELVLGKETEHVDVQILLSSSREEAYIHVLRH